jgi:hypothetical protein
MAKQSHKRREPSQGQQHPSKTDQPNQGSQSEHGGMAKRGVARPMYEMPMQGQSMAMSHEDRREMLKMHHQQTLWIYWTLILLGFWVVLSPFTFGYDKALVEPSGGRQVWLPLQARAQTMTWSDIISGVGLIFFGWRSLTPNRPISLWICCFIGIWLNLAPLLFWSPSAAAYLNGTVVGVLVIALTVLIPGMPNMIMYMKMGGDQPPGWSYNPSSWAQRWILIVLGFAGWMVSRYLGAHQLGYVDHAWDPFFGESTYRVLNSRMSHSWPISDAAFGSFAYTFEFLMGYMGATSRWRTMPWMVTIFGILVIPLGLVHIFLVISQPLVVGEWCTFCLVAAAIMLPMIPLEVDEVIAMGQHMVRSKQRGEPLWSVFWKGGSAEGSTEDKRSPELVTLPENPGTVLKASTWGMTFPSALALSTSLGVWMMFSPAVFGTAKPASDLNHLIGALIVVVSVIAMGEPLRLGRYLNVLLGLGVAITVWFIGTAPLAFQVNSLIVGVVVALLGLPRGPIAERFGSWDKFVR